MKIVLTWDEFIRIAKEAVKDKFEDVDVSTESMVFIIPGGTSSADSEYPKLLTECPKAVAFEIKEK